MDLHGRKQLSSSPEVAMANQVFDQFCNAATLKSILGHFRHLCELLNVRSNTISQFYPKLKAKLRSWKAQALWKKFDQRANHKCYNRGKACLNTRVLIIGGGPCGLRSAIEAQLLGAKVVVVEKRDRMSRNNVLHLWPFVIQDLRGLGAKKFFGKFCAGSIDHISIRQLQCILLKVALILGVEFHENVSFDSLIEPPDEQGEGKIGWRAKTTPADHPVSQYEFDVLIGADGKRNTLEGFKRKEFRGKLAIAITANFINKRTEAEARVEEISGVAFIFNQKFFKELHQETGIDLENIVYYKDDTHYFVMTAKKHSLIDKGVILQDHPDTAKLLAKENVDREALMLYAREAAEFSTEYQMMDMEFAVNHYGQPDVAMFDFTSMYAAENASRVLERHGHRLLMILVGDSLLEPFWPTGSGCARGFLSSLDACWAIKGWGGSPMTPLEVIAERESIYRLLGQTTPENLNRDYAAYTLDPHTRYPNLNVRSVTPIQVRSLLDTDDPDSIKQPTRSEIDIPKKRRRRDFRAEAQVNPETLLRWLQRQVALYDSIHVEDMGASFRDGMAICAIIHRYRPDLLDFHRLQVNEVAKNNQLAFDILDKELGISPIMTGEEMAQSEIPDKLVMFSYLTQIYEAFRGEIPHIKHPKLEPDSEEKPNYSKQISQLTPEQKAQLIGRIAKESVTRMRRSRHSNDNLQSADKKGDTIGRRSRKRRSTEKMGATVEERQRRLEEIEKNRVERMRKRQYLRKMATQQFYKSMQMLQANAKREKDEPFEDYSLFVYRQTAPDFKDRVKYLEQKILYPDREPKIHAGHLRGNVDEEFSGRIKSFEDKLRGSTTTEKKPKDLLRAIGKIEKTDWNVKEIEKKIEENKMGRGVRHDKIERVPKWSREQFLARQIKMEKKGRDPKESDGKYADIDHTLKTVDRKIKEGNVLGYNKVSAMAEQFSNKNQDTEMKIQKSNSRAALALPAQGGSEMCHFCNKRVYLMERLSAEGKYFHRGCFRCEYCSTSLRIGNHTFDREKEGGRFYCTQHFGLSGTMKGRAEKKRNPVLTKENLPNLSTNLKSPEKDKGSLDLLDRGQTPERIEFENLAGVSDAEEAHSQMDEDEWTDRNFGASAAEMGSSDDISDMSDSDEDNEVYEETMDQPLTTEGTLELAKNWTLRYSHGNPVAGQSDTGSNEYEDSSDDYTSEDEESGTATEDEEDIRARELRKLEVWLKVPPRSSDTDTGSETEVKASRDSNDIAISETLVHPEISLVDSTVNATINSVEVKERENSVENDEIAQSIGSSRDSGSSLPKDESIDTPDGRASAGSIILDNDSSERICFDGNDDDGSISGGDVNAAGCNSCSESPSPLRIILPDAVPQNSMEANVSHCNARTNALGASIEENLPDLVASSSKDSRRSSLSSSSETFQSIEVTPGESSEKPEDVGLVNSEDARYPEIMVTPSSPTNEKLPGKMTVEPTRLTVPKEAPKPPVEQDSNSSFDKLIKDLKQRKAKNKMLSQELKPLSSPERAQLNINKYFELSKKSEAPSTRFQAIQRNNAEKVMSSGNAQDGKRESSACLEEKIIELNIQPKVSDKVKSTDIMKYFQRNSIESEDIISNGNAGSRTIEESISLKEVATVDDENLSAINDIVESSICNEDRFGIVEREAEKMRANGIHNPEEESTAVEDILLNRSGTNKKSKQEEINETSDESKKPNGIDDESERKKVNAESASETGVAAGERGYRNLSANTRRDEKMIEGETDERERARANFFEKSVSSFNEKPEKVVFKQISLEENSKKDAEKVAMVVEKRTGVVSTAERIRLDSCAEFAQEAPKKPARKNLVPVEKAPPTPTAPTRKKVERRKSFNSTTGNHGTNHDKAASLKHSDRTAGNISVSSPNSPAVHKKHDLTNKFLANKSKIYDSSKSLTPSKVDKVKDKCTIS